MQDPIKKGPVKTSGPSGGGDCTALLNVGVIVKGVVVLPFLFSKTLHDQETEIINPILD